MRNRISNHSFTVAAALLLALGAPLGALASPQLFVDQGCFNCHGTYHRGDAPTIERLSERLSRIKGDQAAQDKFLREYVAGEMLQDIPPHRRVSPESAKALIRWLAEGAK